MRHLFSMNCIALIATCLLSLSACSIGSPTDAARSGSRALTAEEYVQRHAGNSIRFAREYGGPINREMHYGADGTFQVVDLDRQLIMEGTWEVITFAPHILHTKRTGMIEDGRAYWSEPDYRTMYVYVLPGGTASVFSRSSNGPGTYLQPIPTPGFSARDRFNRINRDIDRARAS